MHSGKLPIENILNNSILAWISMKRGARVLCFNVNSSANVLFDMRGVRADYNCEGQIDELLCNGNKYDYILAFEILEKSAEPIELLKKLKILLNEKGTLYLGTDNRLGLRYFCGDIDISTGKSLSGIQQYNDINTDFLEYRLYAKDEIEHFLLQAGMENTKFYSVLPNLEAAQLIYSHDYLPEERLATRYIPMYHDPSRIFIREEWIYDSLIKNKMFHQMANSYLIEYHADAEEYDDILHVTLSADRGEEYSCATIIYKNKVEKKALFSEGVQRLIRIKSNDDDLTEHGVPMVESIIRNDIYTMPRIDAEILERSMQAALADNVEKFLLLFDKYRDIVYRSSDIVGVDEHGPIMKRCYIDLVPLNCFYKNGQFLFYDQEFYLENEPANLILWRATVIVYDGNPTLSAILPIEKLWDRYGITAYAEEYSCKSREFLRSIRNQEQLSEFNRKHIRDIGRVMENQRKMEHIMIDWQEQKEKYRDTCFDNLEGKEIYIWGSGRYADEFICMYRYDYSIVGVLDNNIEKYNTEFYGYSIKSPEILRGKNPETYKVIVCVKNCNEILEQLHDLSVRYVGVFDINYVYPGRQKYLPGHDGLAQNQQFYVAPSVEGLSEKKYHIGYIAGVFDLFHLGHLNMFRRAKEMCDYLIVGVVSDEGVSINKKTEPFIPFDERIEMVRSCRYVDEAVEIPFVYCRTPEAFRKYHFDVQFSGSDYENDPGWLAMKDYLNQNGSDMVFFSYTEQTSSTKIKGLINKKLDGEQRTVSANADKSKYKLGYCMAVIEETNIDRNAWLHELKNQCEELILGIPDEWIMARLFGDRPYSAAEYRDFLMRTGWFADVIILDAEHLRYPRLIEKIQPDVIFYGGEYGYNYLQDSEYALSHGVRVVSLQPGAKNPAGILDAPLRIALEDVKRQQKIVLFGTGAYFDLYMERFGDKYKPAYAVDNDPAKWGTTKNEIVIECPDVLQSENPADTLVIICNRKYQDIKQQLLDLGFTRYRTLLYKYEVSFLEEFGVAAQEETNYLRENHRIQTILMKEFDAVCQENHLHYYVICGSLIGAVRHKGIIPWDDDIDIAMPREDYKKLKKIAKKIWNKNNAAFRFLNYTDIGGGAFLDCMPRLFYMKEKVPTKCFDKVMGKATADIADRVFIDIYVMDRVHVNEKIHSFCTNIAMKGIYNLMMGHRSFVDYDEYRGVIDDKTLRTMKKVHKLGSMLPIRFLAFWYDAFARSGNLNKRAKDVIMESCAIRCIELKYPIEHFGEGKRVPFETIEVMIPSNYDAQLQDMRYSNYMEFPRMSIRKPSHYFNSDIEIW